MGLPSAVVSRMLPEETTSFVDRRDERKQARALLGQSRLLTITGTGGVGKTRLAVEVSKEVARSFDDVWFVELGALAPSESVPDAIASGIGLQSPVTGTAADLAEHILQRKVLLILDGCEHVIDKCADVIHVVLRMCPNIRIIATSRARLRLKQEVVLSMGTLDTPSKVERRISPAASPAVQLFLDRAARAYDAVDHRDDLDAIAEICRQLDGLPLAIELAAARVKALSPPQIRDRLRESFTILSGGYRDTPRRQRSIRLAIDWSYQLCTPDEQRIWREMSVFVGGWDLPTAEWITGRDGNPTSTLDIVQSLLEKSILVRRQSAGSTWYSMLATIREFGLHQLTAMNALTSALERHRDWYRRLLLRAESEWIGPAQPFWLALLRRELPNIRAALVFCVEARDGDAALELVVTAWRICWQADGRIDELRRWLLRALALPGRGQSVVRAQAFALAAVLEEYQGDHPKAMHHLKQARSAADAIEDPYTTSFVDMAEAELVTDPERAVELYRAAIEIQGSKEIVARANPTARLALYYDRIGRTAEARAIRTAILEEAARRGEQYEASYVLMHAGAMAALRGDVQGALEMSKASLRLKRTLVNPIGVAHLEEVLASVAIQSGQFERAATLLGAADSEREEAGTLPSSFPSFVADIGLVGEKARRVLGSEGFDRAFGRGAALSHDEGIALALDDRSSPRPGKAVELRKEAPLLTPREREVAALVARGLSDSAISSELVVSRRTAEGHVQRILVKLGLTSRTQLAAWYLTAHDESGAPTDR
jgi:non-specific serine/threonine protein kinase